MAGNKYSLTNEERNQQVQELTQRLKEGTRSIFESDRYAEYLKVMSKFTHYSVRNTILIAMQTGGNATMVAGYEAWQKNFGRHVNKGEKAIKIFAPMAQKRKKEVDMVDLETGEPLKNPDGTIMKEEIEVTIPSFRITNVFDIAQTSGPPLPSLVDNISGNVDRYEDFLKAIRTVSPVPVEFEEMDDKDGYYHQTEKRIAINDSLSERQAMAAMIHELAHAKLHALDPDNLKESLKARGKDQRTMEVEAESIAAVVNDYFGNDTSANSWGYVASWSKNKELPELTASLQLIKDTAGEIIKDISEEMQEMWFLYMSKSDALEAMEQGEMVYVAVSKGQFHEGTREDILSAAEDAWFRMPRDHYMEYMSLRSEMDLHEGVTTIQETKLLYVPENQFGIYQINPESRGKEYMFMNLEFMEKHGMEAERSDYELKYVAPLKEEDTLDTIYEQFNIDRPEDFQGHSLSVSDVVVVNKDQQIRAYFVDSFGFTEIPEFLENTLENVAEIKEAAFQIEDRYLSIHVVDSGYDYSIYDQEYKLLDGGVYESEVGLLPVAKDIVQDLKEPVFNTETETYERTSNQGEVYAGSRMIRISYHDLEEKVQNADKVMIPENKTEPEKQSGVYVTFYTAVCEEYHSMGEFRENLTLEEAVKGYKEILKDPTLSYMGNALGFVLHDPELPDYSNTPYPLVEGEVVRGDNLDDVKPFLTHPVVREALEKVREKFPDFPYYAPISLLDALYPVNMTADKIAGALVDIGKDFDLYEFRDSVESEEDLIKMIKYDLYAGKGVEQYSGFLKNIMEEDAEMTAKAGVLLNRISQYSPQIEEEIEPMVRIQLSQSPEIRTGSFMPLAEADELVRRVDENQYKTNSENAKGKRNYVVSFSVMYAMNNEMKTLNGNLCVGFGYGGIIDNIRTETEQNMNSESWLSHQRAKGEEEFQKYMNELHVTMEQTIPYLQQFCKSEEKVKETHEMMPVSETPAENRSIENQKEKVEDQKKPIEEKAKTGTRKKSIHERLNANKEKIARTRGKGEPQKGVELA